jgi:thioester reductase-like protein
MSERKNVFVTGATGFLGGHLTLRLLEQGHNVLALARGSRTASPRERVEQTLREIVDADELLHRYMQRLDVVAGDISQDGLGLDDRAKASVLSVDEIWHCAASLSFSDEDRDEIFRMNVGGTEELLRIVEQTPTRRLHHVSTAYVAGNRPDLALETDIDVGQTFKNAYEQSKCRAELLVADAHQRGAARASVYRPSIVIGDSKTGRITHFHGVYAFIRALWSVLERLRRSVPDAGVVHLPLRVLGSMSGTLNFVPIDYVTDAMAVIGASDSSIGKTYHLTNPEAASNSMWLPHICRIFRVEGLELAGPEAFEEKPLTKLETMFQKQMAFYYMYLQGEPRFDCSQTLEGLRGTGVQCPRVTPEFIEKMAGWYLNYLNERAA